MVRRGGCLGGVVVVAVLLLAVGASMSENPSDSLSASPASPELMRVCRCSGELEEAEKEDAEEGKNTLVHRTTNKCPLRLEIWVTQVRFLDSSKVLLELT